MAKKTSIFCPESLTGLSVIVISAFVVLCLFLFFVQYMRVKDFCKLYNTPYRGNYNYRNFAADFLQKRYTGMDKETIDKDIFDHIKTRMSFQLEYNSIKRWNGIILLLQDAQKSNTKTPYKRICQMLRKQDLDIINNYKPPGRLDINSEVEIYVALHRVIRAKDFYQAEYFQNVPIEKAALEELRKNFDSIQEKK